MSEVAVSDCDGRAGRRDPSFSRPVEGNVCQMSVDVVKEQCTAIPDAHVIVVCTGVIVSGMSVRLISVSD